jgi:NTP pyrophosphatase (non-canonical NTP hydrolase)
MKQHNHITSVEVVELHEMFQKCFRVAAENGWYDDENADVHGILMHISSEVAEAAAAIKSGQLNPDKHIPEFSNFVVELADVVIMIGSLAGALNRTPQVASAIAAKLEFNSTRGYKHTGSIEPETTDTKPTIKNLRLDS